MSTHYEVLDVAPAADPRTITKAYRKAARRLHPDMNGGVHSPEYLAVAEAYEVLSDPEERASYDSELRGEQPEKETTGGATSSGPVYTPAPDWQDAPLGKVSFVNPTPVPVWLTLLASAGVVASGIMHWLAVNIPYQFTIINPGVTLAVLVAAAVLLVALFSSKATGCVGGLVVAGIVWMLFNYLVSTPLAWGGTLLFVVCAYILVAHSLPSLATRSLRARRSWGSRASRRTGPPRTPAAAPPRTAPPTGRPPPSSSGSSTSPASASSTASGCQR